MAPLPPRRSWSSAIGKVSSIGIGHTADGLGNKTAGNKGNVSVDDVNDGLEADRNDCHSSMPSVTSSRIVHVVQGQQT